MPDRALHEPKSILPPDNEGLTTSEAQDAWLLDQLAKSEFFHQKLHAWGLTVTEVADQIEAIRGEMLDWNQSQLGISQKAWDKVIHRGIKPVITFAHPYVLTTIERSVGYYRMLAMVSQKSMIRVGRSTARYEEVAKKPGPATALSIATRLNEIVSHLIEMDDELDEREFDLWRGMAAGSQAQGSWQNRKGDVVEALVKSMVKLRLQERDKIVEEESAESRLVLKDGRTFLFSDEPDIGVMTADKIVTAVEIKGGIDVAGVLERVGASIKSLSRAKEMNPQAVTILLLQAVSVTPQAKNDLHTNRQSVNHLFTVEDIVKHENERERFFSLLGI